MAEQPPTIKVKGTIASDSEPPPPPPGENQVNSFFKKLGGGQYPKLFTFFTFRPFGSVPGLARPGTGPKGRGVKK